MAEDAADDPDKNEPAIPPKDLSRRLLALLGPHRALVAGAAATSVALAGCQLVGPWIVKHAIDGPIAQRNPAGVVVPAVQLLVVTVLLFALETAQGLLTAAAGQRAMSDLRLRLFNHVQRLHVAFFDRMPVGRLMTRVTNDVNSLGEVLGQGVATAAGDIVLLLAIAGLMLWTDWQLALLAFSTGPLLWYAGNVFRAAARKAHREVRSRLSLLNAYLQENLSGIRTIQAYTQEPRRDARFHELNEDFRRVNEAGIFAHAVFYPTVELIGAISLALIVWKGGLSTLHGTVSIGTVVLFISYTQRFFQPIRDLSEKYNVWQTAMVSAERVFRLLDTPPTIVAPPEPKPWDRLHTAIEFRDVWFAYKGEDWVLKGINLTVRRGETVALVGATGSGKTTITNLLLRFHDPQRGTICADGVDLRDLDPQNWRNRSAVVLQDSFLFTGSIGWNIALDRPEVSPEDARDAATAVQADGFVQQLPGGYDFQLTERAGTLSHGQRQLLAFARALAADPDLLILDEATASIDSGTEHLVQQALQRLLTGRTAVVIAHRLSTIRSADRIVVLHHGRVHEQGTHAELMAHDGLYRKLHELQFAEQPLSA